MFIMHSKYLIGLDLLQLIRLLS